MRDQTPEQQEIEKKINDAAKETPCITFGYIGNFERWGDDRRLYLWIDKPRDACGKLGHLWSCEAVELDRPAVSEALIALRHFKAGYDAAKREFETVTT